MTGRIIDWDEDEHSRPLHRPRKEKLDLGLQFTSGPHVGDQVLVMGYWWLVYARWREGGQDVFDLRLAELDMEGK